MAADDDPLRRRKRLESRDIGGMSAAIGRVSTGTVVMWMDKPLMASFSHRTALPTTRPRPAAPRMPMADPSLIRGFFSSAT